MLDPKPRAPRDPSRPPSGDKKTSLAFHAERWVWLNPERRSATVNAYVHAGKYSNGLNREVEDSRLDAETPNEYCHSAIVRSRHMIG